MERFSRIEKLLGEEKCQRLRAARVVVIGLGAVGSYAVEGLARAGIGHLRLVDFDTIQPSNINRQLYALESTVGAAKVDVAVKRVQDINSTCTVEGLKVFAHHDTLPTITDFSPTLVIDAIDSLNPKTAVLAYCFKQEILVYSAMGAAMRTDPSKIKTGDIFDVINCPLARHVRKRLKNQGVGRGITCVYSTEPVTERTLKLSAEFQEEHDEKLGRRRRIMGSLPTLTGIFGLTLANLAIAKITSDEELAHLG